MGVRLQSIEKTVYVAAGFLVFACGAIALTRIPLPSPEENDPGAPPPDAPSSSAVLEPGATVPAQEVPVVQETTSTPDAIGQLCATAPGPNHWICVLPSGDAVDVSIYEDGREDVLYYDDLDPETPGIPMAGVPESATEITNYIGNGCELTIQGIGSQAPTASYICPPTAG